HLRVPAREHALERVLDADVERREAQEHGDDEVRHHDGERVADEPAGEGVHAEGEDYIDPPHPGARCSTRGWWVSCGRAVHREAGPPPPPFFFCGFGGQQFSPSSQGPPPVPCPADAQCSTTPFTKCRQRTSGAFGQGPARTITEVGTPAGV